jgi:integrase
MIDDMQLRNLATGTQKHYIACVASFARFFHDTPANLDIEAVRQFQLYLINQRKLSPEAINIYISAIKFLYLTTLKMSWTSDSFPRARRPRRLPVVLSQQEVRVFFDHVPNLQYRAALMLCYGAGLRIGEAVALKVSDIDSAGGLIRIEQGKGHKDRYAMLSPRLPAPAPLLVRPPTPRLPVPLLAPGAAPQHHSLTPGLPHRRRAGRHHQTRPLAAPRLRHSPAGTALQFRGIQRYPFTPAFSAAKLKKPLAFPAQFAGNWLSVPGFALRETLRLAVSRQNR